MIGHLLRAAKPGSRFFYLVAVLLICPATRLIAQVPDDPAPVDGPMPAEDPVYGPMDVPRAFYLAPWGLSTITWETNTMATPFLTLDQARYEVQRYKQGLGAPQVIQVKVAGGLYPMTDPVYFTSLDSGWPATPTQSYSIQYVSADLIDPFGNHSGTDALFSGGVPLTGWTSVTVNGNISAFRCSVPDSVKDIRDVWMNNQRMVRARFPDAPTCTSPWVSPDTPPCPNNGVLPVYNVEAFTSPNPPYQRYQRMTVGTLGGPTIVAASNWSQVEVVATKYWFTAQQRVTAPVSFPTASQVRFDFPITSWPTHSTYPPDAYQDLGGLGAFRYSSWDTINYLPYTYDFLQMTGEQNFAAHPPLPPRGYAAQAYLTNDLAFLNQEKEWYFDPATRYLYLKTCGNSNPDKTGATIIVPVAQELLRIEDASHLDFYGLDWAFTYQPFPTQPDGATPGYMTEGFGRRWIDGQPIGENNIVSAAITMVGAQDCKFRRSRVAHTGGSGIIIGTHVLQPIDPPVPPPQFLESNNCLVQVCEIFDIGAHGVYIGDEYTIADYDWVQQAQASNLTRDPSNKNWVLDSKVENFGVIYRDSLGITAGHTRDTQIWRNEISYGNYGGISMGTLGEHMQTQATLPAACGVIHPAPYPQSSEGTRIIGNNIHHVMLTLTDGGGIYMVGSHLPSAAYPNSGEMNGNYIHDIVMDPYLNFQSASGAKGLYWDGGNDGWHILNNYIANIQRPYQFSSNFKLDSAHVCVDAPSIVNCDGGSVFDSSSWPSAWTDQCTVTPFTQYGYPGQQWYPGGPNYWLETPGGAYGSYYNCVGYGITSPSNGGMGSLIGAGNTLISVPNSATAAIVQSAGPDDPTWFFPFTIKQIHRRPLCNGLVDPASQLQ